MLNLLVVLLLAGAATAGISNAPSLEYKGNSKHPDLAHHCYFPEHNLSIPVNATLYPTNVQDSCSKLFCREDYVLEIRHCDNHDPRLCKFGPNDYSKPFPGCCPIVTCGDLVFRNKDN